jgi:hypothetical protein
VVWRPAGPFRIVTSDSNKVTVPYYLYKAVSVFAHRSYLEKRLQTQWAIRIVFVE